MSDNLVSIELNKEALEKIQDAIKTINDNLPDLISISKDEKSSMPKMGDKTVAFVNKALEYAKQNPQITPGFLDVTEFSKDVKAVSTLSKVLNPLQQLVEKLDDTATVAGSEAYVAALTFYSAVKNAVRSDVPGAKTIYDDLCNRFPGRGKTRI
jgi:hypothetical protein